MYESEFDSIFHQYLERHLVKKILESVVDILDKAKLYQNDDTHCDFMMQSLPLCTCIPVSDMMSWCHVMSCFITFPSLSQFHVCLWSHSNIQPISILGFGCSEYWDVEEKDNRWKDTVPCLGEKKNSWLISIHTRWTSIFTQLCWGPCWPSCIRARVEFADIRLELLF